MRFYCYLVFVMLFFTSCNKGQEEMPIEREKLINILVDVHVAEAALQEYALQTKDSLGRAYYNKIYSLHGIKEADFNKSMYLLKQDPVELEKVYKDVLAELERREKEGQ